MKIFQLLCASCKQEWTETPKNQQTPVRCGFCGSNWLAAKDLQKEWEQRLREYARDHYEEDGWDYMIETMDDRDVIQMMGNATTYEQAFKNVSEILRRSDSVRRDVEAEIF